MKEKIVGLFLLIIAIISLIIGIKITLREPEKGKLATLPVTRDKIGIVKIYGTIYVPSRPISIFRKKGSDRIIEEIRKLAEDKNVKAIILRFNSPGGSVGAVQEIFEEIEKVKKKGIKVIASFGDIATSGAYYLASNCDWIVANPGTITGSIGVLMGFTSLEGAFKKLGIDIEVIKSGKYKDIGNISRKLSEEEKKLLKDVVFDVYEQFVDAVARGRNISKDKVYELAQGQIFTGRKAKELGLVDELGNLDTAIERAKKLAGIRGKPKIVYPKEYGIHEIIGLIETLNENYEYIKHIF